jgi:hypothetical protein
VIAWAKNRIDLVVTLLTLILSTVGFLLGVYALAVISLIGGGISLGLQLDSHNSSTEE